MAKINWRPTANRKALLERALMLKNIRAFFDGRGVIEVETPLLSQYATTDPHLDSLSTRFQGQRYFLNTSPEYAMKRLLAEWGQSIYQIGKAFRDDELGVNHNPEFTLLEWYRPGFDMAQLMDELAELVDCLCSTSDHFLPGELSEGGRSGDSKSIKNISFERLSYRQAFEDATGLNPHQVTSKQCHQAAMAGNVEIPQGLTEDDEVSEWLDWLLTQLVLPAFDKQCFTFLYDYPAQQCALAKIEINAQSESVAKRFELFYGEVELANGFYELTDASEQLLRFQQENRRREQVGKEPMAIDENLIAALQSGLPVCSGVALGLDRLLMVLVGATHIDQVVSFSWGNN
jgi:lysyl-tRNA synthetase class 2